MSLPPSRLASFSVDRPFHTGSNSKGIFSPQQPLFWTMLQNKHSAIAKLQARSSHSFQSSEREIHKPFKKLPLVISAINHLQHPAPYVHDTQTRYRHIFLFLPDNLHIWPHAYYVFPFQPYSDSPGSHPTRFDIMLHIYIPPMQISGSNVNTSCRFL